MFKYMEYSSAVLESHAFTIPHLGQLGYGTRLPSAYHLSWRVHEAKQDHFHGCQGRCSDWVLLHTAQLSWPWLWHPLCKLALKLDQTPGSVPKGKYYIQIIYCFLCDKVGLDAWVMLEPLCISKGATCGLDRLPKGDVHHCLLSRYSENG